MSEFKALVFKNWVLYKRNLIGNILEIIVPLAFLGFFILTRNLITIDYYPESQLLNNSQYTRTFYGTASAASASSASYFLKNCNQSGAIGLVALSPPPSSNILSNLLNNSLISSGYTTKEFASDQDINSYIRDENYGSLSMPLICFGITLDDSTSPTYSYSLRFNVTGRREAFKTDQAITLDTDLDLITLSLEMYSGFLATQIMVNNIILQSEVGDSSKVLKSQIGPLYQEAYYDDDYYIQMARSIAIITLLPLLVLFLRLVSSMVTEKEKKIRQSMSIMGMTRWNYFLTWFLRYYIICLVIHIPGSFMALQALQTTPIYLPLILVLLFDIVLILQGFFIQIFFTRSKIAILSGLLFFLSQYILILVVENTSNADANFNTYASIVPHVALILSFKSMAYAESFSLTPNLKDAVNKFSFGIAALLLLANIFVWTLLVWYLDQVFPNQHGTTKDRCFCLLPEKATLQDVDLEQVNAIQSQILPQTQKIKPKPSYEEVGQTYQKMEQDQKLIKIENLYKKYDGCDFYAVRNVNVKIYYDQIFVLLGHNGAGKTSIISMITGMTQPTLGRININGSDDIEQIRKCLGVCPQHDTLYEDLTVKDHLRLFASFRGMQGAELDQEVQQLILDVDLQEKADEMSKSLSGGQKRRLSIAMAFAGKANIIIMDEPTSGMDTSSRRYIWELLKKYKQGRIIIITTHFMDEADYLGDRIGIMGSGQLLCCGSSLYLKNKFNSGYHLTLTKINSQISSPSIITCVQKHIKDVKVLLDISSELSLQLPIEQVEQFSKMFRQLDQKKQSLGIEAYGISIITLQEVFLKVIDLYLDDEDDEPAQIQQIQDRIDSNAFSPSRHTSNQKGNLQLKRYKTKQSSNKIKMVEDYSEVQFETEIQNNKMNMRKKQSMIDSSTELLPTKNVSRQHNQKINKKRTKSPFEEEQNCEVKCCSTFWNHLGVILLKRLCILRRDLKSLILQIILPLAIITGALFLMKISFVNDLPKLTVKAQTYTAKDNQNNIVLPIGSSDPTLLTSIGGIVSIAFGNLVDVKMDLIHLNKYQFDQYFAFPLKTNNHQTLRGAIFFESPTSLTVNGNPVTQYVSTSLLNTKTPSSSLFIPTLSHELLMKKYINPNITLSVSNYPFPLTHMDALTNIAISGFLASFIFTIALAFKFASVISFVIKERTEKVKYQHIVSGINLYSYWLGKLYYQQNLGNYIYDYVIYLIVAIYAGIMCQVMNISALQAPEALFFVWSFLLFYGLSYLPFTYVFSFLFQDHGDAQASYYFLTFIIGGMVPTITYVLRVLSDQTNSISKIISWVLRTIPAYSFGEGLLNVGAIDMLSHRENNDIKQSYWNLEVGLAPLIYLIAAIFLYFLILAVIQNWQNSQSCNCCFNTQIQNTSLQENIEIIDSDVLNEKLILQKDSPTKYQLMTRNLLKIFESSPESKNKSRCNRQKKYKIAVDNLCLGVKKGEVFCLLGVNGAGKTTTFKILSGEITQNEGEIYHQGKLLNNSNVAQFRRSLGYCPQFDALVENLTVKEQLELYYDLKTLPEKVKEPQIKKIIKELNLKKYEDALSGTLSGGNKRKLSLAMALIGNPQMLFLDEPSTGMDPKARRFMWNVLTKIAHTNKEATIILTTHLMEEAEVLASRMGIMINGNFKCLGTAQHIKRKYGEGLELDLKFEEMSLSDERMLAAMIDSWNRSTVGKDQLQQFLLRIKISEEMRKEIREDIFIRENLLLSENLDHDFNLNTEKICLKILTLQKQVRCKQFLQKNIGASQFLELVDRFAKMRVLESKVSLGKLFELLEQNKKQLRIIQYSVKQATIEQIFNRLAKENHIKIDDDVE